jgi:hypothetical protein
MNWPSRLVAYTLCRTSGRKEKEKAIRGRFSNRMETRFLISTLSAWECPDPQPLRYTCLTWRVI